MGVDNSDYRFIKKEKSDTILRLASKVFKTVHEPKLTISIRSKEKSKVQNVAQKLEASFINYGLYFTTNEKEKIRTELTKYKGEFRSARITIANSNLGNQGSTSLKYDEFNNDTSAYIELPNENKNEIIKQLCSFLGSVNDFSDFGPESEEEIVEFSNTIFSLNQQVRNADKWKFETGCIEFIPINEKRSQNSESQKRSISGLKVQFSKIHAIAYKSKGIVDLASSILKSRNLTEAKYYINSKNRETLKLIDSLETREIECYFNYELDSFDKVEQLDWLLNDNECTIELHESSFDAKDEFKFSLCISGDSVENLDVDLFIAYQAPNEYKEKVLNLFEGKMHHVGDG